MNKKLLLLTSLHAVSGYTLLFLVKILTDFGYLSANSYAFNGIITAVAVIVSLVFTVIYNLNTKGEKLTIPDIAFPLIFSLALYGLYLIPPLGFIGIKGVSNSVLSAFFFLIAGQYLKNIAYYADSKKKPQNISDRNKKSYSYSLNGISIDSTGNIKVNSDISHFCGYLFYLVGILVSVYNLFNPVIDFSMIIESFS